MRADRPFHAREDRLLSEIAVQLDIRTGEGQTRWTDADIAPYLRTHGLSVHYTHSTVVIAGVPPSRETDATAVERPTPKEQVAPSGRSADSELGKHGRPLEKGHRKAALRFDGNAAQ